MSIVRRLGDAAFLWTGTCPQDGVLHALRRVCEANGCVENQREAAALLCSLAVPYENKLALAESSSAAPLMTLCQSTDVEVSHADGVRERVERGYGMEKERRVLLRDELAADLLRFEVGMGVRHK